MSRFCPLLSAKLLNGKPHEVQRNISKLRFPMVASPKFDGWRIFEYNGRASTRSLKPNEPKNLHTRAVLAELYRRLREDKNLVGVDGEVVAGDENAPNAMQTTTSAVGSYEGQPDINYLVFDSYQYRDRPFLDRLSYVREKLAYLGNEYPWVRVVDHVPIENLEQMWAYMSQQMALGYEGIMLRDPAGRYKMGRSSLNEGILVAVKKWETAEGRIIGINEQLANLNEARINALGHTERSGHMEFLVGKNTMGSVTVKSEEFEEPFNVGGGPGLDDALRKYIWEHPAEFMNGILTYRYQAEGVKTRPRFPQWVSMRDQADMDRGRKV